MIAVGKCQYYLARAKIKILLAQKFYSINAEEIELLPSWGYHVKPQSLEIKQLVDMYLDKELLLPEMQRKYVWTSTKIRDLIDSVYHDYPSGSILLWKTDQLPETRESAIEGASEDRIHEKLLLLDGQQRITSLATIISGHPIRIKDNDEVLERHIEIYFNLDHPDKPYSEKTELEDEDGQDAEEIKNQFFQVKNKGIENQPNWISVTTLFTKGPGEILKNLKVGCDHPKFELYNKRLNRLFNRQENYVYPVQILPKELSYPEATLVFVRVNSQGTRLSGADLALAQVTSRWSGSMKLFENFSDLCSKSGFFFDEGLLMRCIMAAATGQCKFDRVPKIPIVKIQNAWNEVKEGMIFVVNFVRQNALIPTTDIIPTPYVFIPILVYSVRNDFCLGKEERGFLTWFYAASMWGRYGKGSSESILDQDLNALNETNPTEALLRNLKQQVGRIEITGKDIEGKGRNSPFFMMTYVIAVKNGAKDWGTGISLNLTHIGESHQVQHDHIFPKVKLAAFLKEKYHNEQNHELKVKKLVNDLANIAFLSKRENPRKASRLPKEYLKKIREKLGEGALMSQAIPLDEKLWELENYEKFLETRRQLLVAGINNFIDSLQKNKDSSGNQSSTQTLTLSHSGEQLDSIYSLGQDIISLLGQINKIRLSKSQSEIFRFTNTMISKFAYVGKPTRTPDEFGNLIDACYQIIYEGSGNLARIPQELKYENSIVFTIKFLRNDLRHDLEHGDEKEIIVKRIKIAKIYERFTGKTTIASLVENDLMTFQMNFLKELRDFLENLKNYNAMVE